MAGFAILLLIIGEAAAITEVQNFLIDNGHHYVDIFFNSSSSDLSQLIPKNTHFTRIQMEKIKESNPDGFGVFFFDPERDDVFSYLCHIAKRKIKMTLLIITGSSNNDILEMVQNSMLEVETTAFFYIAILELKSWYQIISLKSGSVVNRLNFANNSLRIIESFDLQKLEIRSTSLTWHPYLVIDDCNKYGLECKKNYGYLVDYMDLLAR